MQKTTKKEWTALCRSCAWCGKRSEEQAVAQQGVDNHLKTHPRHNVRLMVTGQDNAGIVATEQKRIEEVWNLIAKHKRQGKIRIVHS